MGRLNLVEYRKVRRVLRATVEELRSGRLSARQRYRIEQRAMGLRDELTMLQSFGNIPAEQKALREMAKDA